MFFSIALIFTGLFTGYGIQLLLRKNPSPVDIRLIRKRIQQVILILIIPITIVFSLWIAPLRQVEIVFVPILGGIAPLFGGAAALFLSRFLKLTREQRGLFIVSGIFTNMGSLGGLVVLLLLGEKAFALVAIYQLFEKLDYFLVGFPVAKEHSSHRAEKTVLTRILLEVFLDPVIIMNTAAIVLGGVLNFSGLERPVYFGDFNRLAVPAASFALLVSIGLAMRFGSVRNHLKAAGFIILIKGVLTPVVITALGFLLGLGDFADGLVLKTVFILSAMPVGFMSLVPPTLYDMEMDQVNTCWLLSTLSLVVVVPVLKWCLPLVG